MVARPLIIDCDPGHDDAVALLLAVGSPQVDLRAVTTTFGNCSVEDATRNALQILTLARATDIPVARGAAGGIDGKATLGNYVHGVSGLDGPPMPEPGFDVVPETATELLRRTIETSTEPVTIAATGPITNVAQLLLDHPTVKDGIHEIVFMGGSTERGNHTPTAEFNTFADPEALDLVLNSGLPVRMVGLNLTHQALATPAVVERMAAMDHVVGRTCAAWMGFFGASYNRVWEFEAPPVHDPCTIAGLIDPDLIAWRDAFVAVELDGRWTRGTTVVDLHQRYPDQQPNVHVAMSLDAPRYWDLVLSAIDRVGQQS
ncbi:MAG TPA: nucleoside hydrolase [Intrasporangium sp.]|jgi:purine nucleosidase/pyrimidine-specific ribonucleoside hydrolase|uniref:nucleoside hydrolase n=1 Tax=Intrasporangium sp. TaxID=1925024 RepID=UPI002F95E159